MSTSPGRVEQFTHPHRADAVAGLQPPLALVLVGRDHLLGDPVDVAPDERRHPGDDLQPEVGFQVRGRNNLGQESVRHHLLPESVRPHERVRGDAVLGESPRVLQ